LNRARQGNAADAVLAGRIQHVKEPDDVGPHQHRKVGVIGLRGQVHHAVYATHGLANTCAVGQIDDDGIFELWRFYTIEPTNAVPTPNQLLAYGLSDGTRRTGDENYGHDSS
jgi:hypothetical protein